MYTAITILIVIVSVLLVLVVLVQNPKGGGLASGFTGAGQVMGVKKTSEFIEKLTWGLIGSLIVLCLAASFSVPTASTEASSSMQEQIDNASAAPQNQPAQNAPAQPAQPAPGQPAQQNPPAPTK